MEFELDHFLLLFILRLEITDCMLNDIVEHHRFGCF
ncbi:hypothetical protein EAN90_02240 [Vibrio parahaemolyticus]|nr:hypothetical protein [Vibrio parahaemolyticus]